MYIMNRPIKWEEYLHLAEFTYNNRYQASLKMSLFEELYGRRCNTPVSWQNPVNESHLDQKCWKTWRKKSSISNKTWRHPKTDIRVMQIETGWINNSKLVSMCILKWNYTRVHWILDHMPKLHPYIVDHSTFRKGWDQYLISLLCLLILNT